MINENIIKILPNQVSNKENIDLLTKINNTNWIPDGINSILLPHIIKKSILLPDCVQWFYSITNDLLYTQKTKKLINTILKEQNLPFKKGIDVRCNGLLYQYALACCLALHFIINDLPYIVQIPSRKGTDKDILIINKITGERTIISCKLSSKERVASLKLHKEQLKNNENIKNVYYATLERISNKDQYDGKKILSDITSIFDYGDFFLTRQTVYIKATKLGWSTLEDLLIKFK